MYVIYADELFLENLIIDYILLIVTARLAGIPSKRLRVFSGAIIGAAYAVVAALSGMSFLMSGALKLVVGVIMVLTVFGSEKSFIKLCLIFFAVSAAFAGAVMASMMLGGGVYDLSYGNVTFGVLAMSFAVSYAVFSLVFRGMARHRVKEEITEIVIENGGKSVKLTALFDTGNELRDPMTGRPVTICSLNSLSGLFDGKTRRVLENTHDPAEALSLLSDVRGKVRFSLVPYSSVGRKEGLLLAFKPERFSCGGKSFKNVLVAIALEGIGSAGGYSAITNIS